MPEGQMRIEELSNIITPNNHLITMVRMVQTTCDFSLTDV